MATIFVDNKDKLPERKKNDFYPTQHGVVRFALEQLSFIQTIGSLQVLDIGAGTGVWGDVLHWMHPDKFMRLIGVDIDEQYTKPDTYDSWLIGDFNKLSFLRNSYDYIIGNPPFGVAEKIVRKALKLLKPNGYMLMLLPSDFLFADRRWTSDFGETIRTPSTVYNLNPRLDFTGKGNNPNNYSLIKWDGKNHDITQLKFSSWKKYRDWKIP